MAVFELIIKQKNKKAFAIYRQVVRELSNPENTPLEDVLKTIVFEKVVQRPSFRFVYFTNKK